MSDGFTEFERQFSQSLQVHILEFLRKQEFPHLQLIETEESDEEASERYCGLVVLSSLVIIGVHLANQRGLSQEDIEKVLDDYKKALASIVIEVTSPGGSG